MSCVRRTEDMSPDGYLELFQQDDGDIIVEVYSSEGGEFSLTSAKAVEAMQESVRRATEDD